MITLYTGDQPYNCKSALFGRSILARGMHALLPPIEVVKESICNADPDNPRQWEATLPAKLAGRKPTRVVRRAPFVQVPLGVTEDRLVGTVDIEASMKVEPVDLCLVREGGKNVKESCKQMLPAQHDELATEQPANDGLSTAGRCSRFGAVGSSKAQHAWQHAHKTLKPKRA